MFECLVRSASAQNSNQQSHPTDDERNPTHRGNRAKESRSVNGEQIKASGKKRNADNKSPTGNAQCRAARARIPGQETDNQQCQSMRELIGDGGVPGGLIGFGESRGQGVRAKRPHYNAGCTKQRSGGKKYTSRHGYIRTLDEIHAASTANAVFSFFMAFFSI